MDPPITQRRAARAVLLTPDDRILLVLMREPRSGIAQWSTPGGGIEAGESAATGLRREVYEETGLRDFAIGPHIWNRDCTFIWDGETIRQREAYYLVHTEQFDPALTVDDPEEIAAFCQFGWWTAPEIAASADRFIPARLGEHLGALVRQGAPAAPFDIGA